MNEVLIVVGFIVVCLIAGVMEVTFKGFITGVDEENTPSRNNDQMLDFMMNMTNNHLFNQFMQQSITEAQKNATPFEMGGYDMTQGNSWNYNSHFNNDFGGPGMF